MAGSSSSEDNPVAINIVPMVDVIFCLCLFFMCSLKFKQLEGKIETWLPKDRGVEQTIPDKVVMEEIRVFMRWKDGQTVIKVGNRPPANSDIELMQTILQMANDYKKLGKQDFPVLIDALEDVPWKDVIHVLDLCKKEKLERIEFAAPLELPKRAGN